MFEEVKRRGLESAPDFIQVDSSDGGSGAAPMPLMDNVGLLIRELLPIVDNLRKLHGLKERVRLVASGKFVTPAGVDLGALRRRRFRRLGARLHVRRRFRAAAAPALSRAHCAGQRELRSVQSAVSEPG